MSGFDLEYIPEPLLRFGHDQCAEDPRHGLFLFGPLKDTRRPRQMRVGVVGTPSGIAAYKAWVSSINAFIPAARVEAAHQAAYPGFESAFHAKWEQEPIVILPVSQADVSRSIRLSDRHVAVYETVGLFVDPIRRRLRTDDVTVDLWFIVIPEIVHTFGRPLSRVPTGERVLIERRITSRMAKRFRSEPSLFEEDMREAKVYAYDLDFHDQLKARLLALKAVTQVVRESSLVRSDVDQQATRRLQDPATVAWNMTTTAYFKAGGRPWKLDTVREKVCYIGIVFKVDPRDSTGRTACCGAQMFLDSGDGLVFKGAIGKWYSEKTREYHLDEMSAYALLSSVIEEYEGIHGFRPEELFIHSKTRFNDEEWAGFSAAAAGVTNLVGVKINRSNDVKAFRPGTTPVLRGTALKMSQRRAYLWSAGYIPQLRTYPGREVPNPLSVEVYKGEADIMTTLSDVLGLTKLNFNACIFGDGLPVTLRFADSVGSILTAGPQEDLPPLPFRHYI